MEPMETMPTLAAIARIADQMPGGFFIYRADQKEEILYGNDVLLDIFGCDNMEQFRRLTGGTFRGLVCSDDLETVERTISAQVTTDRRHLDHVEYRIKRRDGAVRWIDDYGRLVHTQDCGEVYYVLIQDVTELHESQQENIRRAEVIEGLSVDFTSIYLLNLNTGSMRPYRLQNECFRTIAAELNGTADTVDSGAANAAAGTVDSGAKNAANNDADTLIGTKADWRNVLPTYAERYVIAEDRPRFLREISEDTIRRRLASEKSYAVDYRYRNAKSGDNDILYMQMSVVLIGERDDARHAIMGFRDITEQTRRVQKDMSERMHMELELEREKNANEVKSSFLFNLSHDIRTPMNAIMGFTELARRHMQDPDRLREDLARVDESSRHLLSLIDDLLEMSRIDYGRTELKAEPCDLREEMSVALDMFRAQAEQKHIHLEERIDLPEGKVLTDSSRFRRVLGNLIGNAVKFTPENGAVVLSARRKQVSDSGYARFEFSVADTGIGMTEEFMKRMYDAFEREETSTRSGFAGTGMGLSITKRLLDMMGGSIAVKSKKGVGSTFTVDLPLKLAEYAPAKSETTAENQAPKGEGRILLVEDIEINRMLAETILEEAGFQVESVPDGCDAVDAINNHPAWYFDLVLMDIQMPVMNGYEATRAIRALGREDAKKIPIIALSANARDEDKRMSMESGMNHHIAKPFDVAQLISTVNEHIAARAGVE